MRAGAIGIGSALLAGVLAPCAFAATGATVSGTVRDTNGSPQTGTLIELLTPEATLIAQAITDAQGRYLLRIARAGIYQIRATPSFLPSVLQSRLVLRSGAQTVADLTLPTDALPRSVRAVNSRQTEQHADDWRWVLRSPANRPLLRLVNDNDAESAPVGSASEVEHEQTRLSGEMRVTGGSAAFGQGRVGQSFAVERTPSSGDTTRLRAAWTDDATSSPEVALQLQRMHAAGAKGRFAILLSAHPDVVSKGSDGYRVLQSAATESFTLGNLVQVDVGTLLTAEQLVGSRLESSPYLRVGITPTPTVSVEYRYATDRSLQRSADLDTNSQRLEVLADVAGRPLAHAGSHHELALTRTLPSTTVSVAVFHDELPVQAVEGVGALNVGSTASQPLVVDSSTSTFRLSAPGMRTEGVRASFVGCSHGAAFARVEAAYGRVLGAPTNPTTLSAFATQVGSRPVAMVRASAHVSSTHSGTGVETSYRWQPHWSLSQVDAFDANPNDAYLGVAFVQHLWSGARSGTVEAILQASNLLAEGYIPVISADGREVYLAQVPRIVQATLAFHF